MPRWRGLRTRARESGRVNIRITMGLTFRTLARRISRLKDGGVCTPPGYNSGLYFARPPGGCCSRRLCPNSLMTACYQACGSYLWRDNYDKENKE